MKKKLTKTALILCTVIILLAGCRKGTMPEERNDSLYRVYCTNAAASQLLHWDYRLTEKEDIAKQVQELIEAMRVVEPEEERYSAIPADVQVQDIKIDAGLLTVNFDAMYTSMDISREIILRAAVVKTVSQVEGVDYVSFTVAEKPLMDARGNTVGMMQAGNFLENLSGTDDAMQPVTLILYYANKAGDKLIETERTVLYDSDVSVERLVLNQLVEGPSGEDVYATLPSSTRIMGVRVKDGVCYVNLDNSFIEKALDVADYIPIYSIVNSLSELSGINRVQISINGSSDIMFREMISLNQQFERNLDYIGGMND